MELSFSMADLYPNLGGVETSTMVTPEVDDQDALNEDVRMAGESTNTEARSKQVFLAIGVLVALIIFLGGK